MHSSEVFHRFSGLDSYKTLETVASFSLHLLSWRSDITKWAWCFGQEVIIAFLADKFEAAYGPDLFLEEKVWVPETR